MARMTVDGIGDIVDGLANLETTMRRSGTRRIIQAGADVVIAEEGANIQAYNHVTPDGGDMLRSVGATEYRETFDGGSIEVYPQGRDRNGVSNALKAFVIDSGRGSNPTRRGTQNKTGDHFITGNFNKAKEKAKDAMAAEASTVLQESGLMG